MNAEPERISGALQENILSLLCFDDKNCKMVRSGLTVQLFESSVYREVAGHAIDFIDAYGEAIWAVYDLRKFWKSYGPRVASVRKQAEPGRNDPCSCGSGKKYKKCHGA